MKKENLERAVQLKEELDNSVEALRYMDSRNNWTCVLCIKLNAKDYELKVSDRLHKRIKAAIEESINEINKEIEEL